MLFTPYIASATTKDFLVSGECGNVNASGVITFLELDDKVLVRERLSFKGTSSGMWSDRIANLGQWASKMSEKSVAVLSKHPDMDSIAARNYSLVGDELNVSGACSLSGNQTAQFGDVSLPVFYATTSREGAFSGGQVSLDYDPFGAILLVAQEDGASCMASISAKQVRKIGENGVQIFPQIKQVLGPENCIPNSRGATVLLNRADASVARVFRSAPMLNLAGNGNADKVKAILAGNMSGLGSVGGTLQTSTDSSVPWPDVVELEGGMAGVTVDTKGISLSMSAEQIRDDFGLEVLPRQWNFHNAGGLEPSHVARKDVASLSVYGKSGDKEKESIKIDLSQWHTGNHPLRIIRTIDISDPQLRPAKDVFEGAIFKKYGENFSDEDYGYGWRTKVWHYDNGALSQDCTSLEIPKRLIEAYGGGMNRKERLLSRVQGSDICDGFVQVNYSVNSSGFVDQYNVTIMDTLGLVFDVWNGERVTLEMQETYLERLKSQNKATPKL